MDLYILTLNLEEARASVPMFDVHTHLVGRNPRLRFQCFLASRHANQAPRSLRRELPNLSRAGYWWHNLYPDAVGRV